MLAMIASNRYVDFMFIMRTIGLVFVFVLCCFMVIPVDGAKLQAGKYARAKPDIGAHIPCGLRSVVVGLRRACAVLCRHLVLPRGSLAGHV